MRVLAAIAAVLIGLKLAASGYPVMLLVAVVIAAVLWFGPRAAPAAARGMRRVEIHTHGGHGTRTAARHEAGHRRMAKALGWKVRSAEIFPDGSGVTRLDIPKNAPVEHHVAIDVSGGIAAGTWAGCGSDLAYMREDLKRVPAKDRARVKRAGYALARRTVGGWIFDGGVSSDADKIYKNGRI